MNHLNPMDLMVLLIPVVGTIGLFVYLTVATWSRAQQKEREATRRAELLRRLAELPGDAAASVLSILREDEARALRRRLEGRFLAGLIWLVVGVAVIAAGHISGTLERGGGWAIGLIPTFVGCAVLVHTTVLAIAARVARSKG